MDLEKSDEHEYLIGESNMTLLTHALCIIHTAKMALLNFNPDTAPKVSQRYIDGVIDVLSSIEVPFEVLQGKDVDEN